MRYFEPEGFEEYYNCILKNDISEAKKSKGYYIDPDVCRYVGKTEYYSWLTKFLNCREPKRESTDKYLYIPPKKAMGICKEDKKNKYIDDYKIVVVKNDEVLFRLTSDQFGFSAVESIYVTEAKMKKYPLSRMVLLSRNETDEQEEEIRKQLIEYVENSRTLGGAFVWPTFKKNRQGRYNAPRGVNSYIEDRVDLTLLEIKHALDGEYDKDNFSSDILYNEYKKDDGIMKTWLKHFGTFDNYIDFFMLEPFVAEVNGQKIPVDIISGEPLNIDKVGKLQQLNLEKLQEVVIRVENMIIQRTTCMEQVV